METMSAHPTVLTDRLTRCLSLAESVLHRSPSGGKSPTRQYCCNATPEQSSWTCQLAWQDSDLVIMASPDGRTVWHQPLPATSLSLADFDAPMEHAPIGLPFGLLSAGSIYQDSIRHVFANHTECSIVTDVYQIDLPQADHSALVVNMVAIRLLDDSLRTILEKSPELYSRRFHWRLPPLGFGGHVFMVSHDSATRESETDQECEQRLAWNADCQCRADLETANEPHSRRPRSRFHHGGQSSGLYDA